LAQFQKSIHFPKSRSEEFFFLLRINPKWIQFGAILGNGLGYDVVAESFAELFRW
jgi:hypothetical protein